MNTFNSKQSALTTNLNAGFSATINRLLIASAFLFCFGEVQARTIFQPRSSLTYISKFSCGFQGRQSVNSPTNLEAGRYQTSFAVFNPGANALTNISVFASIPGQPAVQVDALSIPGLGTGLVNCADLFSAFGVIGSPNVVVGFIYIKRLQNDLEIQTTFTRSVTGGASVDVERIEPRETILPLFEPIERVQTQ